MRRRAAALLLMLLGSILLSVAVATPALAHAALLQTAPGDAEILERSPAEVTLTFNETVGLGLGNLKVVTPDGDRVDTAVATRTDGGKVVRIPLRPNLAEGSYLVIWRVISADSHPVSGAFTFSVGKPSADPKELLGRGNITELSETSDTPGIALGISRFVGFSALTVLLGGAVFCLLLWPAGTVRLRRLLLGAAALELLSAVSALLLQGPYASGNTLAKTFDATLLKAVLDSQYGVATATRIGFALLAVLAVAVVRGRRGAGLVTALAVGVAGGYSAAGHAGVGTWQPFTFLSDVSHLVTVSAWVGGLVIVILGVRGRWSAQEQHALLPRWSRLATWSVALLIATGTFASIREVGGIEALFTTDYGVVLLIKIGVVGLMLLFALIGRSYVRKHHSAVDVVTPSEEDVAGLRRGVSIEAGLAVIVLGLTAVLVNTTPAKAAFAPPYSGRSEAGPVTVQVDIYPARKGRNGLHVYTVGAGGRTRDVAEVTGYVERGKERLTLNTKRKSLGHYEDLTLILPAKGTWAIVLQIRTSDVDSYGTKQEFEVK